VTTEREPTDRHRPSWLSVVWMIAAATLYLPAGIYLQNPAAIRSPMAHGLIATAVVSALVGAVAVLTRRGLERSTATYGAMTFVLMFLTGSTFIDMFGLGGGILAGVVFVIGLGWFYHRLVELRAFHAVMFFAAVFLTAAPWAVHFEPRDGTSVEASASHVPYTGNGYLPDIYLIVLDAYPGVQTMQAIDGWTGEIVGELEQRGFIVRPAWSAYALTEFSLPSLFDASYPVQSADGVASIDGPALRRLSGGAGSVYRYLDDAGYHLTMLESSWAGSRCGPQIDTCVESAILDDLFYFTLQRTYLRPWLDRHIGSGWIHGAKRTMRWIDGRADSLAANGRPDFVFAHLILPHPPFLLDSSCEIRYRRQFDHVVVGLMPEEGVVDAFLDQAGCVDRYLLDLADRMGDAVVVITSDHGVELAGQLTRDVSTWTHDDVAQRLGTLFAMRAPDACLPASPVIVPNLLRGVMRCMGADGLADLSPRMFLSGPGRDDQGRTVMIELASRELDSLLGGVQMSD
jgi:hypothetical protein